MIAPLAYLIVTRIRVYIIQTTDITTSLNIVILAEVLHPRMVMRLNNKTRSWPIKRNLWHWSVIITRQYGICLWLTTKYVIVLLFRIDALFSLGLLILIIGYRLNRVLVVFDFLRLIKIALFNYTALSLINYA